MNSAFTLQTAKIVGAPADGCWSQIHTFSPEDNEKKEKRGELFAVLVISGVGEGIEAVAVGREILVRFHEEYYGNLQGSAFERLGFAVKKVCEENEGLELVAASLVGKVLCLSVCGQGKVLLKRGEKLGIILKSYSENQKVWSINGFLQDGDLILLGSEGFFKVVAEGVIRAAFGSGSPVEAVEAIAPIVLGRDDVAGAAGVFGLIKSQELSSEIPMVESLANDENSQIKENPPAEELAEDKKKPLSKLPFIKRNKSSKKKLLILIFLIFGLLTAVLGAVFTKTNFFKMAKTPEIVRPVQEESTKANEMTVSEARVLFDAGSISAQVKAGTMVFVSDKIAVADGTEKKAFLLNKEGKIEETLSLDSPAKLAVCKNKLYFLTEKGVSEIQIVDKAKIVLKIKKDKGWGEITALSCFNGNLYLLDKENNSLWRYLAVGGFSAKKNWFLQQADLSKAVSMAIDGAVWILNGKKIEKFNLGKKEDFVLSKMPASTRGEPDDFLDPVKLYTTDKEENLFVLDRGRGKIYVIAKNGEFLKSYVWEEFKQADDFFVSETEGKIFLLSRNKIYEIGIK